ncbi:M23 family metallopeptidase [Candidatus Uhrbacteria bacterium]|nr:M23 family metallopeptidase [Candidatus Uhrbacteria bacterium]
MSKSIIRTYILLFIAAIAMAVFVSAIGVKLIRSGGASALFAPGIRRENQSPYRREAVEITPKAAYTRLMEQAGIDRTDADAIFSAAQNVYDLTKIREGRTLDLYFSKDTGELEKLAYQIDSEDELVVTRVSNAEDLPPLLTSPRAGEEISPPFQGGVRGGSRLLGWHATRTPINYEIRVKKVAGALETSLYEWALTHSVDERAIIEFANALEWSIDFAHDPQAGDRFAFIYEERYRDGAYIMPGTVFAGKYVNVDKEHLAFYFEESADNQGYFDADGNSLQKLFLKAPVAYRYISSGFTTGLRYVRAFNVATGHRAIDYAAAHGTPVRTTANGTVTYAGRSGSYGNFITVRHNGTYSTNYAHLSRLAVRSGQKIAQGETIGYVGSTGFSTGPHLHYEMEKHGVKINPLKEVLPPGKPIAPENKDKFFKEIKPYFKELRE